MLGNGRTYPRFQVYKSYPYYTGGKMVEIRSGHPDVGSPDMLAGYHTTHDSAVDALDEAIRLRDELNAKIDKNDWESLWVIDASFGDDYIIDPMTESPDSADSILRQLAREHDDSRPLCPRCQEPMPCFMGDFEGYAADDWSGLLYCSEQCAEREREYQDRMEYLDRCLGVDNVGCIIDGGVKTHTESSFALLDLAMEFDWEEDNWHNAYMTRQLKSKGADNLTTDDLEYLDYLAELALSYLNDNWTKESCWLEWNECSLVLYGPEQTESAM